MTSSPERFHLPPARELSYLYFGNASFAVSDGESVLAIDPFFSRQFEWKGRTERYLNRPTIPAAAVQPLHGVLVSHEHGDHCDPATVQEMLSQPECFVYAPQATIDTLTAGGVGASRCIRLGKGTVFNIGAMHITSCPAIESEDEDEPIQRVGFLIEYAGTTLYHQGDSHGPARSWQEFRERLDALIVWPVYVDSYVMQMKPPSIIFHHMDRFEPGDFFCNKDSARELAYWSYRYPDIRFVVPQRNRWYSAKTHEPLGD